MPERHLESLRTLGQYSHTQKQSGTLTGHQTARKTPSPPKTMKVRVTVFWPSDYWTRKGLSSTGKRLVSGNSVAVDPRIIPYYSTLSFFTKSGKREFRAIDSGSAVKSRLASRKTGRNEPVIDVFFKTKSAAKAFLTTLPKNQIVEVTIHKKTTKAPAGT